MEIVPALRRQLDPFGPVWRAYRRLRPRWLWTRLTPHGRATARYLEEQELVVRRGPFTGLRYPPSVIARNSFLTAKLLGTYELELHDVFARADHELFVDIGSGDGYYCVGYARARPGAEVIGYELDASERRLAEELARLNGVDVTFRGVADHAALQALPPGNLLLLVDVEGYERELLDPARVPRLNAATMVVEVHTHVHPDLVEELSNRFAATHEVSVVRGRRRQIEDYPELGNWGPELAELAVNEGRLSGTWLVLSPR